MRSFFQSLLALVTLGMVQAGCGRQGAPATPMDSPPMDVTMLVPGMN
jgi:predicted small lipoprotein YifL